MHINTYAQPQDIKFYDTSGERNLKKKLVKPVLANVNCVIINRDKVGDTDFIISVIFPLFM